MTLLGEIQHKAKKVLIYLLREKHAINYQERFTVN